MRTRWRTDSGDDTGGELNLTPYLDIVTTLVIFLVFTFQVVIEFRTIDLLPRGLGEVVDEGPELTLLVHHRGYRITYADRAIDLPKVGDTWDTARLNEELDRAKRELGLGSRIVITAPEDLEYEVVVAAMDAARERDGRSLFPDLQLAKPVREG